MASKTIYPYGSGGTLPDNIGIVNDLTTGGADKALSAEMGKVLDEKILPWTNVEEDGFFIVDEDMNIGAQIVDGGFQSINSLTVTKL